MSDDRNARILVVDDNAAIHEDFRKVLQAGGGQDRHVLDMEQALFGEGDEQVAGASSEGEEAYEIVSARQGQEALELVRASVDSGEPFALAFVDVRMPPGWDGVETLSRLWQVDPNLQAVICTAYSDYTWSETVARLGRSDRLLVLKKPFDAIEVCQMASALVEKWNVTRRERQRLEEVRSAEREARAYAASLETVNRALETALATAEETGRARSEFLLNITRELLRPMADLLRHAGDLQSGDPRSAEWIEAASALRREGGALQRLLRDIVDLSELEAGGLTLERRPCEPYSLARNALEEARARAAARGVVLRLECASPVPTRIESDGDRLLRALDRLLGNAIDRSPRGEEVCLRLGMESTESWKEPALRIELVDRGERIPAERRGRLFEPFQSDPDSSIGLSLSKRLAQLLGGDVSVQSEEDLGTRFVLTVRTGALDGVAMLD
jgi:signal transduction histidine kinase